MDERMKDAAKAAALKHVHTLLNVKLNTPLPTNPPQGASGLVLFGVQNSSGQSVAVKVQAQLGMSVRLPSRDPEPAARFLTPSCSCSFMYVMLCTCTPQPLCCGLQEVGVMQYLAAAAAPYAPPFIIGHRSHALIPRPSGGPGAVWHFIVMEAFGGGVEASGPCSLIERSGEATE